MALPVLYTKKETCKQLKISERELGRMIEKGMICYDYKYNTRIFFKEETLEKYLESIAVRI
ncbi:MAG: helix-turn-helix domain-containing protein [Dysgonamonadaceae bacterium]|jgi:predicted site-specific integrase-resolvase|nr:helix-turn-helix domain-containing protein [Dysgonamonadaceae bacterium]